MIIGDFDINKIKDLLSCQARILSDLNDFDKTISASDNEAIIVALSDSKKTYENDLINVKNKLKNERDEIVLQRKLTGEQISEYVDWISDEISNYNINNKNSESLTKLISEIKSILKELEESEANFNELDSLINSIDSEKLIELKTTATPALFVEIEQIIPENYEFSLFNIKNKHGYSLSDFFYKHKEQIRKVIDYYNEDILKTINYLQRKHGLCIGKIIKEDTFKSLCVKHKLLETVRKDSICITIDKDRIKGKNNNEIFRNFIITLGIREVYEKCSDMFSNSLMISDKIINDAPNQTKHLCDSNLYYLNFSLSSEKMKTIVFRIKDRLNSSHNISVF